VVIVGDAYPFALPETAGKDRLAELGQLAGGLVHELKNPLGVISLNAELLLAQPGLDERTRKRLGRILDSARNLEAISRAFLAYARPGRPDPDAVDVNALLQHLLDGQGEAWQRAQVTVAFHPDPALAFLAADRQHLASLFANVLDNARDALIERARDRRLLVVTRAAAGLVRVVIANNGPPLPDDVAAHLFEPFHSSKEHGTGLGLAIVRRLVELHHGTVSVASDPDQGVSFTFEFPTALGPATPRTQLPVPTAEATVRDDDSGQHRLIRPAEPDPTTRVRRRPRVGR